MELLTVQETAQMLRVHPVTIRRYIADGRLPAVRVGKGVRVRKESAEQLITPVEPTTEGPNQPVQAGRPLTYKDPPWKLVGSATDAAPVKTKVAKRVPSGKPTSAHDPLWNIVGTGRSDGPTDVSERKHKYLAEAYAAETK